MKQWNVTKTGYFSNNLLVVVLMDLLVERTYVLQRTCFKDGLADFWIDASVSFIYFIYYIYYYFDFISLAPHIVIRSLNRYSPHCHLRRNCRESGGA